jgi:hypothetical protein
MGTMAEPSYRWGGDPQGLQIGVQIAPAQVRPGDVVDVKAAVHNGSPAPLTVESQFSLIVQRGDLLDEHTGGPRSSEPLEVAPGAILQVVAWQLDGEQLGTLPGPRVLWVAYRPSTTAELRSGQARLEVRP